MRWRSESRYDLSFFRRRDGGPRCITVFLLLSRFRLNGRASLWIRLRISTACCLGSEGRGRTRKLTVPDWLVCASLTSLLPLLGSAQYRHALRRARFSVPYAYHQIYIYNGDIVMSSKDVADCLCDCTFSVSGGVGESSSASISASNSSMHSASVYRFAPLASSACIFPPFPLLLVGFR